MSDKSPIQRIKELDQERATLFEQAKEEALQRASSLSDLAVCAVDIGYPC
jgi:hypothetical protein